MIKLLVLVAFLLFFSPAMAQQQACDPSYPTGENGQKICISPGPPDLDCKDIPYRRFKVLSPDPHRFDGDKDGIGCELDS